MYFFNFFLQKFQVKCTCNWTISHGSLEYGFSLEYRIYLKNACPFVASKYFAPLIFQSGGNVRYYPSCLSASILRYQKRRDNQPDGENFHFTANRKEMIEEGEIERFYTWGFPFFRHFFLCISIQIIATKSFDIKKKNKITFIIILVDRQLLCTNS